MPTISPAKDSPTTAQPEPQLLITPTMQVRFAKDATALRPELERHLRSLARLANLPTSLVDDMVAEVIVKWYFALPRLNPDQDPKPYILQIARRVWLDALRARARSREVSWPVSPEGQPLDIPAHGPTAEEQACQGEFQEMVERILADRPDWHRHIWDLFQRGHSRQEIASTLSRPYHTVAGALLRIEAAILQAIESPDLSE